MKRKLRLKENLASRLLPLYGCDSEDWPVISDLPTSEDTADFLKADENEATGSAGATRGLNHGRSRLPVDL